MSNPQTHGQALLRRPRAALICAVVALLTAPSAIAAPADDGERFTHIAGIAIGHLTLNDVRNRFGPAPLLSEGDAGEAVSRLCYWLPREHVAVTFRSGELGGRAQDVLGVDAVRVARRPAQCRNAGLADVAALAQLPAGLRFGARPVDVAATIGLPRPAKGIEHLRQMFASKLPLKGGTFDLTITVDARFTAERMSTLSVDRVLTN